MAGKHPVLLFLRRGRGRNDGPIKQLEFRTVRLEADERGSVEFEVNPCVSILGVVMKMEK